MDEDLVYLIVELICLVLLFLLLLMSCCVRNRDFTRSYVLFSLIPMTIRSVDLFIIFLDYNFRILSGYRTLDNIIYIISYYIRSIVDFSQTTGIIVFLFMSIMAACERKEFGTFATWFPYFLTILLSFVLGFIQKNFFRGVIYSVLFCVLLVLFAICMILILLIPFITCCCASSNRGKSSSPVVYNANSRLGWAGVFAIFALFPTVITQIPIDYGQPCYFFVYFLSLAQPIIFVLAAILFLPAYRTVFFCSTDVQDFRHLAVAPTQPANNTGVQAPHQSPFTVQPAQSFQQQQIDQNLAAYLTNPNQLQNLANQLTVPTVSQCPNCKYPPVQSQPNVSHPQMLQHQHPLLLQPTAPPMTLLAPDMMAQQQMMPMQTTVQTTVSHNHPMVQQQSNLVRFASQPNLVQFNTMQPAYSMPHLASAQSPFVVQQ